MRKDCDCKKRKDFYRSFDTIDEHPFKDVTIDEITIQRNFSKDLSADQLKWHWDSEDRIIKAFHSTDWKFQFDNELPISLNQEIHIDAGRIHRLIKGSGSLSLKIVK